MATIKTFIALRVAQRVNNNVSSVVSRLAARCDHFTWVEPENLHVALNYVGAVNDVEVPELCKLIKQAVEVHEPFEMSLRHVGGFPNAEQPRTLWIGVEEGIDALNSLYKSLESVLHHWGVNKDRNPFVPHMTLGRIGRSGRWNDELLELVHKLRNHDGGICSVNEVIVYTSFRERGAIAYTPMATIRLKGPVDEDS